MRLTTLKLAAFAAFAFGAMSVASAQAEGPFFSHCGKKEGTTCVEYVRLKKGQTMTPTSEATKTFVLEAKKLGVTLECTKLKLEKALLNGSEVGTAGTSTQTDVFSGCTVEGNGEKCAVEGGTMSTVPLIVTLAKEDKVATKGEKFLLSLAPKESNVFMTVKFKAEPGGKCTITSGNIELAANAKLGVTGTADNIAQEQVKFEETETLGESSLITFPKTLLTNEFIEEGGVVTEAQEGLTFSKNPVNRFEGQAKVIVASTDWGVFGK
jgi:hypothetical protein